MWQSISRRTEALATLVLRALNPGSAGAFALGRLQKLLEYRFDLLYGRYRAPAVPDVGGTVERWSDLDRLAALESLWQGADPA